MRLYTVAKFAQVRRAVSVTYWYTVVVKLCRLTMAFTDAQHDMGSSTDALQRAIDAEGTRFTASSSSSSNEVLQQTTEGEEVGGTWLEPPMDVEADVPEEGWTGKELYVSHKYEKRGNGYSYGDVIYHRSEAALSKVCKVSWQNRGPRPEDGNMPSKWKGQSWRPISNKWSTRGGKFKDHFDGKYGKNGWGKNWWGKNW